MPAPLATQPRVQFTNKKAPSGWAGLFNSIGAGKLSFRLDKRAEAQVIREARLQVEGPQIGCSTVSKCEEGEHRTRQDRSQNRNQDRNRSRSQQANPLPGWRLVNVAHPQGESRQEQKPG